MQQVLKVQAQEVPIGPCGIAPSAGIIHPVAGSIDVLWPPGSESSVELKTILGQNPPLLPLSLSLLPNSEISTHHGSDPSGTRRTEDPRLISTYVKGDIFLLSCKCFLNPFIKSSLL